MTQKHNSLETTRQPTNYNKTKLCIDTKQKRYTYIVYVYVCVKLTN